MEEFFKQYKKSTTNQENKLIIPIFMYYMDILPINEIKTVLSHNNSINGYLIICEGYKKMNFEKIKKYTNFIHHNFKADLFVKFGQGHPSKLHIYIILI